ncbi:MAG: hypothetical protein RIQ79_2605 [Verrucomicrobiota bacterium]
MASETVTVSLLEERKLWVIAAVALLVVPPLLAVVHWV